MSQPNPFEPPQAWTRPTPMPKRRRVSVTVGWMGLVILLVFLRYPWPILMLMGELLALIGFFPIGEARRASAYTAQEAL